MSNAVVVVAVVLGVLGVVLSLGILSRAARLLTKNRAERLTKSRESLDSGAMITMSASERVALAAAIGVNEQYLYQCLTGRRLTPSDRCPSIERATQGRVTCEELRADVRWHRVPDAAWPWHPGGRPLIDVARAPTADMRSAA